MKSDDIILEVGGLATDTANTENTIGLSLKDMQVEAVSFPDFASMVPEGEAVADPEDDGFTLLREKGYFSPVRGMANIQKTLNNALFAKICKDKDGMRHIEFCQQYRNGEFSEMMRLPQKGMRLAAQYKFLSKGIEETPIRNRVTKFVLDAYDEYNGKFSGEESDCLEVVDILNVLYVAMPGLPVYEDGVKELSPEEFYKRIAHHAQEIETFNIYRNKSYFMLDNAGIEKLAHLMGMKPSELLEQLKKHGFLYLTKSSKGYQTNARLKGADGKSFTEWVYCIYKLEFFAGIPETAKEDGGLEF